MPSAGPSSAGGSPPRCAPTLRGTPRRWRAGRAGRRRKTRWFITRTAASSTSRFVTPSGSPKKVPFTSVGSRGDSYDNALAETVMGLYKTELIRPRGPWRTAEQVELATAAWVDWWNRRRLHSAASNLPPAEYEQRYHDRQATAVVA